MRRKDCFSRRILFKCQSMQFMLLLRSAFLLIKWELYHSFDFGEMNSIFFYEISIFSPVKNFIITHLIPGRWVVYFFYEISRFLPVKNFIITHLIPGRWVVYFFYEISRFLPVKNFIWRLLFCSFDFREMNSIFFNEISIFLTVKNFIITCLISGRWVVYFF
jgi:hypothetical protein